MRAILLSRVPLLIAAFLSVASAATAMAVPECTYTTPTTTQCERPGNAQINTSPSANNDNWGWPWWGGSGITIGIGGIFG